jgi:hypothetical protein
MKKLLMILFIMFLGYYVAKEMGYVTDLTDLAAKLDEFWLAFKELVGLVEETTV